MEQILICDFWKWNENLKWRLRFKTMHWRFGDSKVNKASNRGSQLAAEHIKKKESIE